MIPTPSGVRVWLAVGHSDMRRGMHSLALQVQQALGRDPHCGDLYVFRGRKADLVKIVWHDGIGMSLYAKKLEKAWHQAGPSIWGMAGALPVIGPPQEFRRPSLPGGRHHDERSGPFRLLCYRQD